MDVARVVVVAKPQRVFYKFAQLVEIAPLVSMFVHARQGCHALARCPDARVESLI
jgi:hypothetical protein